MQTLITRLAAPFTVKARPVAPAGPTAVQELSSALAELEPLREQMAKANAEMEQLRPIASEPHQLRGKLDALLASRKGLLASKMLNVQPAPGGPSAEDLAAQITEARTELEAASEQAEAAEYALQQIAQDHGRASEEYQARYKALEHLRTRIAEEWLEDRAKVHLKAWDAFLASYVDFHSAGMALNIWASESLESRGRLHQGASMIMTTPVAFLPRLGFTGADIFAVADVTSRIESARPAHLADLRKFLADQG